MANDRELSVRVERHTGSRTRCPCCWRPMTQAKRRPGSRSYGTDRSKGHVYSANAAPGHRDVWFYMCRDCNEAQGSRELGQWARSLAHYGDSRAVRVAALCDVVYEWLDARGRRIVNDHALAAYVRSRGDGADPVY